MGALILADSLLSQEYSLLAALRKKSQELTEQIENIQDNIEEFNIEYYSRFSELLYDIFKLEKDLGYESADNKLKALEEHEKDDKDKKECKKLDLDSRMALRHLYRNTARQIHPDRPSPELTKEEAHKLMQKLNEAYERQDLDAVKQISETWAKGYKGETRQEILQQIEKLQTTIKSQENTIESLKSTQTYINLTKAQRDIAWWDVEKKSLIEKLNFLTAKQISLGAA